MKVGDKYILEISEIDTENNLVKFNNNSIYLMEDTVKKLHKLKMKEENNEKTDNK